jgi:hypothetical protein
MPKDKPLIFHVTIPEISLHHCKKPMSVRRNAKKENPGGHELSKQAWVP